MPPQIMDKRGASASSHYYEEIRCASELPLPRNSWTSMDSQPNTASSLYSQSQTPGLNGETNTRGIGCESSLFSSSLSELFSRKLRLSRNDALESAISIASELGEVEPFESLEEIEARTIGNLLPDEDELFSGVIGEVRNNSRASSGDELEDFDVFSSGGGMELEGSYQKKGHRGVNSVYVGDHLHSECPSRTLIVRNINSKIEDSELKALFAQYGDIQSLDTACKPYGFVMVSYYDIRAAQNAIRSLQGKLFRRQNLAVFYSVRKENRLEAAFNKAILTVSTPDSSLSYNELLQVFGSCGEIKEIRQTMNKNHLKFIEFYDVRAAEAAFISLNGSEIAGKQIKIEKGYMGSESDILPLGNMASVSPGIIASSRVESGSNKILHNLACSPVNSCIEPNRSLGIPVDLRSSAKLMPFDKPIGSQESHPSPNGLKFFSNQAMPDLHSQSFPEYREGFAHGSPYDASRTFVEMVGNGVKLNGGRNAGFASAAASNGHPIGLSPQGFGSLGNGQVSHGNHHIWNNNSQQQHSPNSVIWPHSPSSINGVHAHHLPPVAAFPRAPPMLVKVGSPVHQIGSAPAINPTLWDRRHAYLAAESPEASGFHQGSPSHHMEISPRNAFAQFAGNCMEMSATINVGPRSPHLFSGRNSMISMPASFDSPNERSRSFSHRRSDSSSNSADKKQFELDIDRISRGEDSRTTLMIKNIPNKYTSKMLLAAIDDHCKGTYDFIYLPIDFKNKCNVGYAFINMTDPQKIISFHKAFDGKKWEKFNSEKVASLAYARIQGKAALVAHFQNSSLMNEDKRCRPILFHTDGPNAGDQEPFPMGTNIRSRLCKPRTLNNKDDSYSHGSSSHSSTNKPDHLNRANSPSNSS